jgi:hypothetical protein
VSRRRKPPTLEPRPPHPSEALPRLTDDEFAVATDRWRRWERDMAPYPTSDARLAFGAGFAAALAFLRGVQ